MHCMILLRNLPAGDGGGAHRVPVVEGVADSHVPETEDSDHPLGRVKDNHGTFDKIIGLVSLLIFYQNYAVVKSNASIELEIILLNSKSKFI